MAAKHNRHCKNCNSFVKKGEDYCKQHKSDCIFVDIWRYFFG